MKQTKQYAFNGFAGCVVQKKARQTGTLVGVYCSEQAEVGDCGDATTTWMTVCEVHNCLVGHSSLKNALPWSSVPEDWCEFCRARQNKYVLDEDPWAANREGASFSFTNFLENNPNLEECEKEAVRDLEVGETYRLGGGAAAEFVIKRVA